jgi:V8-like Glu-specific endopeptidase
LGKIGIARISVGRYCKCTVKNGQPKWSRATAWLMKKDLLVTCAHCVMHQCKECRERPPAKHIKTYLGYNGRDTIGEKDDAKGVEFRAAKCFAVRQDWITDQQSVQSWYDVAVIKLQMPFEFAEPLSYDATPSTFAGVLETIGYPTDKEHGEKMYGERKRHVFNMGKDEKAMLTHHLSTAPGM